MKSLSMILTVLLALMIGAGIAEAAKAAKAPKVKPLAGSISKIDGANITVTGKDGTDTTVTTTDSTVVTIKGATKAVSDLTVGMKVRVTLDTDGKTAKAITSGKAEAPASAPASQP